MCSRDDDPTMHDRTAEHGGPECTDPRNTWSVVPCADPFAVTAREALSRAAGCTCPPIWNGVLPPTCPVHNPEPSPCADPFAVTAREALSRAAEVFADTCPDCGHRWSAHMSALFAERARAMGIDPVPCIEDGGPRGRYICGCPGIRPPSTLRPVPGHI